MSPDVFESLGRHGGGRMTKNRLRKVVSSVLSAWTNWSVYNFTFIDELESKFEGRIISAAVVQNQDEEESESLSADDGEKEDFAASDKGLAVVSTTPRGMWTSAESIDVQGTEQDTIDDLDGEALDDLDGEELEDVDGQALEDVDGVALDDVDGEEWDDIDGDALDGSD